MRTGYLDDMKSGTGVLTFTDGLASRIDGIWSKDVLRSGTALLRNGAVLFNLTPT